MKTEEFKQILGDVKSIEGMNPEKAVDVALTLVQESGKDKRTEIMNGNRNGNGSNGGDKPITEKQKKFMQDLGITVTPNMTSREASRLIDQSRNNGKGRASAPSSQK
jgi:hypothetical protein